MAQVMASVAQNRQAATLLALAVSFALIGWFGVARIQAANASQQNAFLAYSEDGPGLEFAGGTMVIVVPNQREDELTLEEVLSLTIANLESFWAKEMPVLFGEAYSPLQATIAYSPERGSIPPCGDDYPSPSEYRNQAFYCGRGDFIAWDGVNLFPRYYERFGGLAVGLVLAHEWGHAVQARIGYYARDPYPELQADCYAGAWFAAIPAESSLYDAKERIEPALRGLFHHLGDPTGIGLNEDSTHGTPIQRQNAFVDGVTNGGAACLNYGS